MKRLIITIFMVVVMVVLPVSHAFAATSQDVTITATPSYLSISNSPSSWAPGTVATSSSYWSKGSTPTFPLDDAECQFTVSNNGSIQVDITATSFNFTGGVGWTIAGSVGADTVVLKVGKSGDANEDAMVTLTTSAQAFIADLAASGTLKWEMKLDTGTFTDGVEKSGKVTLTAAAG